MKGKPTPVMQICLALFASAVITTASAEPINIRFSHAVAEDTPKGQMALRFQQLVKERLGDSRAKVTIYPNSTLFNDNKVVDEMLKGNVELAAPSMSKLKKYTKRLQVFDIPFLFVTPEAATKFLAGPYGKRMLRLVASKGLIGLGYLDNGMKQLSANQPIKLPSDVNGLKFRIQNSDVLEAQFKALNAVPIRAPFSKVYALLEQGEVDGQENTWSNIYSKKFHDHQPYIIESNHGYLGYMILTSQKFWKELPDDIRPVLEDALAQALEHGNQIAVDKAKRDRENVMVSGQAEIHTMTVEERKLWTLAMQPVWKSYEDEIGSELIQAAASAR